MILFLSTIAYFIVRMKSAQTFLLLIGYTIRSLTRVNLWSWVSYVRELNYLAQIVFFFLVSSATMLFQFSFFLLLNFRHVDDSSYFYLYRVSYIWYNPLGFLITLIVGYVTSLITSRIFHKDAREPDPSLFVPFLASRIRRRRQNEGKTTNSQVFVLESRKWNERSSSNRE